MTLRLYVIIKYVKINLELLEVLAFWTFINVHFFISEDRFFFVFLGFSQKVYLKHNAVNAKIIILSCYHIFFYKN